MEEEKGKTIFGTVEAIASPTPKWATTIFRVEFVLNKVVLGILSASSLFTPEQVKESLVWIAAIDTAVWLFGRFIGVKKEDYEK